MQGNIQIEVLNQNEVRVSSNLKNVSVYGKQVLMMSLASSLNLTQADLFLIISLYSDFLAKIQLRQNGFIEQSFHP